MPSRKKNQANKVHQAHYGKALRLKADDARAHYDLEIGQPEGKNEIRRGHQRITKQPSALNPITRKPTTSGTACFAKGRIDEAIRQFQENLRLEPDDAQAYNNLGIAYAQNGQIAEVTGQFQEALRLKPDYAAARDNLARVH